MKVSPIRVSVYKLLVDGIGPNSGMTVASAAVKLQISRQAVEKHVNILEAEGYLARIAGTRSPVMYKRGPRSNVLDRTELPVQQEVQPLDGGTVADNLGGLHSKKPSEIYVPTSRAHCNGRFIFSVTKLGDLGEIKIVRDGQEARVRVFENEPYIDHNSVKVWKGKLPFDAETMSVEYLESPKVRQLHVWPQEEELVPDQFDRAVQIFQGRAQQAVNLLAKHGGWQFGLIQFKGKIELASSEERILANIPEDLKCSPGSPLWVDESMGPREIETSDPEVARAVFDFPGTVKELRAGIAEVKRSGSRIEDIEAKADRLISISEKLERAIENIAATEATLIERSARDLTEKVEHISEVMYG